ncbi:aromatic ring-hydroxylating dioxygenase subunit alpha [Leeia sp. TBRC 13508]|uniref:Aromatic ring-hydroxylating dioxygenase subunit alpha n=1 Tax=Leeia speluncae TaxID=2884804 RepID=A0ABS8D1M5_9NEIS|nr:aromatic ring-hydroxylating dioxygenase subunit alpha [Leeia speluncae]MCB6182094.1 aromatic ring-hydroxylating dioxygenase subunit alpha [Leeia speluncae]
MTTQQKTISLIKQRQPRQVLSGALYTDPDVYREDLAQIWHKEWIFAGHTFELEKAGQFITLQVGDFPVVIVRGTDGEIRAFHNVCPHRGSKLCNSSSGKSAKLVCPYHKWTFSLEGKLQFAGNMGNEFDPQSHGLKQVHAAIVETYIYVCVAETAPDFEGFRKALTPFVSPHNLADCKVAFESTIVEKGNWKLVFENNRECYHCEGNHPELLNSFVENLSVAGVADDSDPELSAFWDRCETAGLPSQMVMSDNGQYRITRIPLSANASSYTMDGKPAVNGRLDKSGVENIGALLYFNYPSTWNHFLGDHALSFRVLPLGPGETMVTTKWLVHKDAVEGVDYDLTRLTEVWIATNDQDRRLVEGTHAGVSSPAYQAGNYSAVAENGPSQFDDWYCNTMKSRIAD